MKYWLEKGIALAAAPLLGVCMTAQAQDYKECAFKLATQNPKGHPIVTGMEKFAEIVAAKSGGKIKVNLFPGGVLGSDAANVSALQGGTLEMVVLNAGIRLRNKPMITGTTEIIAHIGYPTHAFQSPMIYNPYFEQAGVDVVVVPMACEAADYPAFLQAVFTLRNIRGALITMPHKVATVALLDDAGPAVQIAGACNAVRRRADGRLQGELFDGEGFVRGVRRKGFNLPGARALIAGCGGVGSAIAASLAAAGVGALSLYDVRNESAQRLAQRLAVHYPAIDIQTSNNDPAGHALVVNATPMGMNDDDPLPLDVSRIAPEAFVGEVVMKQEMTAFLRAAQARGCRFQVGRDMLFEQIPAYLEFFGLPVATPEVLLAVARLN